MEQTLDGRRNLVVVRVCADNMHRCNLRGVGMGSEGCARLLPFLVTADGTSLVENSHLVRATSLKTRTLILCMKTNRPATTHHLLRGQLPHMQLMDAPDAVHRRHTLLQLLDTHPERDTLQHRLAGFIFARKQERLQSPQMFIQALCQATRRVFYISGYTQNCLCALCYLRYQSEPRLNV